MGARQTKKNKKNLKSIDWQVRKTANEMQESDKGVLCVCVSQPDMSYSSEPQSFTVVQKHISKSHFCTVVTCSFITMNTHTHTHTHAHIQSHIHHLADRDIHWSAFVLIRCWKDFPSNAVSSPVWIMFPEIQQWPGFFCLFLFELKGPCVVLEKKFILRILVLQH